jgi:hypothetical protein
LRRALVAVVAALVLFAPAPAAAVPPKQCDPVRVDGRGYKVIAHGVTCRFARRWVKRYLRTMAHPTGYRCSKPSSSSRVKVNCQGSTKPANDPNYRYYYGIRR